MNQIAFAKNDGTTLSEGNVYKSNTGASGGAIYVEGSVLTSKGDVFTKNKATGKGGAVYVNNKGALFVENGRFEENSAVRGGAITNDNGSPLIVHNSVFSKNTASEYGGALFHGNGQFEVYDSEFTNNTSALSGGAVASVFDVANTLKFVRSTFTGNKGFLGGAMAIYYGLEVTDSKFTGNTTTGIDDGGGAINLGGHAKVSITGTTFDGNTANLGGAISTRPAYYLDLGNTTNPKGDGHWLQISNSTFTNNVATVEDKLNNTAAYSGYGMFNGFGGAIATGFRGSTMNGVDIGNYIEDSTFTGNKASYGGGALYNQGNLTVRGTTILAGNTAQYGGAVYTDANSLTFDATSASDVISFTNNTATAANGGSDLYLGKHTRVDTDKANYKAAEVNLTGLGTISFGGSIAGLAGTSINSSAAKVSIADAAAFAGDFTITDGLTTISGAKFFGGNVSVEGGTLAVDGAWTASGSTTLNGGMITTAGANVFKKGDDGKYGTTLTDGWTALNKTNGKVELTDTGYDYTIEQLRAAQNALNGGSGSEVQLVLHGTLTTDKPLTDTTVDGLIAADQTVSANASGNFVVSNGTTVGSIDFKEAENAESVAITTGTATLTIEGNGGDVFANLSDTVKTVDASNSSVALGQSEESKGSVNVETLKVKNLEVVGTFDAVNAEVESLDVSGNFTAAELKVAEGDVTGTLSADKLTGTADKVINVGDDVDAGTVHLDTLALNGGTIFLDPSWTDVSGIKNDIASYGLTAYAGKSFGAAKIVGELAWLKSENDITAHQTALNQKLDANIWSAGVRAQYELAAGSFKFVPSIGLRVSRLETDDMTVGSIKVDEGDLTYVQMPISLRISGFEADAAGWTLAPSFKVAYVPTFGDKEVKVLGYSQDVLDMSPVQADFGLRAVNGNLMFNVDMMLGGGEAGTSSIGGKVGVKYAF